MKIKRKKIQNFTIHFRVMCSMTMLVKQSSRIKRADLISKWSLVLKMRHLIPRFSFLVPNVHTCIILLLTLRLMAKIKLVALGPINAELKTTFFLILREDPNQFWFFAFYLNSEKVPYFASECHCCANLVLLSALNSKHWMTPMATNCFTSLVETQLHQWSDYKWMHSPGIDKRLFCLSLALVIIPAE